MGVGNSEGGRIEGDGIKEGRVQGMELVIFPMQNEVMAFGVGGVHKAAPQEEAMAHSSGGVHEANPTLDVTSPPTPSMLEILFVSNSQC
jgi:hypothetical protein